MSEIKGHQILIAGGGREGQCVLSYLSDQFPDVKITVADNDPGKLSGLKDLKTRSGLHWLDDLDIYDTVVRSPGVSPHLVQFKKAKHITSATNIFFAICPGQIIGATGTKGKSTTSSLIYRILKTTYEDVRLVGNIGSPALCNLKGATDRTIFVMELSSYQLQDFRYSPHIAVILPIFEEHLNYHGNQKYYVDAKSKIVLKQKSSDYVIFYQKNGFSRDIGESSPGLKLPYAHKSQNQPAAWLESGFIWISADAKSQKLIQMSNLPIIGIANAENAAAAILVGLVMGVSPPQIRKALMSFQPLEHRLEYVGDFNGINFYNDSLATIPEATMHALKALGDSVATLIAGGYDRGLNMDLLGKKLADYHIQTIILFPDTGVKIEKAIKTINPKSTIKFFNVKSMDEAVRLAYQETPKGKICLLSPAAASFNMFCDYADRGNQFKTLVADLSSQPA
ncbi:UDP-N-acetylmuramoylalanine--D-glutamate ligase [Candidatus Gottesmanbacteria bacterium RBG_16_43_7]|uniref:UDP-N-acetylmuramoylalanine--D-glutamate ligase n=1 Tax=Candidatus Gottesmanbacteria bacterium RBG_16_43_7 TaxID=1798373 RepID=A0A1F5Z814_9BACT|nr:MAG: UDP-N-acetylmuramoylalanine--D-glutamate ligase [Candidatus Gottesmanbacteria bacterium RBG_16_43_7]